MFWNKKERVKGLPDLPPMGSQMGAEYSSNESGNSSHEEIPDEMHNDSSSQSLPSFPDSPPQQGFSQSMIKEAVNHEDASLGENNLPSLSSFSNGMPEFPSTPTFKPLPTMPMMPQSSMSLQSNDTSIPWASSLHVPPVNLPPSIPIPQFERSTPKRYTKSDDDKPSDIFVRLDRFYTARKALETTKEKLSEIDEMLRKIRETKLREEQELNAWEKQLADVKNRMQDVVQNIFEKVE